MTAWGWDWLRRDHGPHAVPDGQRVGVVERRVDTDDQHAGYRRVLRVPGQVRVRAGCARHAPERRDVRPAGSVDDERQRREQADEHALQDIDEEHAREGEHAEPHLDRGLLAQSQQLAAWR